MVSTRDLPAPADPALEPSAEERILQATSAALAQLDPAALTIKHICQAAQVTPPTVYYHYGNKDGLIAAAVEHLVADWLAAMDSAVSRDADLDGTIDQAVAAWVASIVSPARPLVVFAWATLLLADTSELARTALVQARARGAALIRENVVRHLGPGPVADVVTSLVVDSVIASGVQYELDHDADALRSRLEALGAALRLVAAR